MQNGTIGKVIAASAVLVVLIGIVLHFFGGTPEPAVATASTVTKTQDSVPSERFSHRRVAAEPEIESPQQMDHDEAILPKLPREKVEEYLTRKNRSAASLLAAFHELDDTNYLNEAAAKFPNDLQLQWTILAGDAFPEDRRKWLDLFKASSPDNALANYFSAADYFKNGQSDLAIRELVEASGKNQFQDSP